MEREFHFDTTGSVYEWDPGYSAWVHIGKLCGRSRKQFVRDYLERQEQEWLSTSMDADMSNPWNDNAY